MEHVSDLGGYWARYGEHLALPSKSGEELDAGDVLAVVGDGGRDQGTGVSTTITAAVHVGSILTRPASAVTWCVYD